VNTVTKLKQVMKGTLKPYIVYLGIEHPPQRYSFPAGYNFRDPFTRRILHQEDRPVYFSDNLHSGIPRRLYARNTVRRMPRVGWDGDPRDIVGVIID
jgi:hypothetical protein